MSYEIDEFKELQECLNQAYDAAIAARLYPMTAHESSDTDKSSTALTEPKLVVMSSCWIENASVTFLAVRCDRFGVLGVLRGECQVLQSGIGPNQQKCVKKAWVTRYRFVEVQQLQRELRPCLVV